MWTIEYYSVQVEEDILRLPAGLLARYLRLVDMLIEFGANLGMPHTRAMGDGQRGHSQSILLYGCRAAADCLALFCKENREDAP